MVLLGMLESKILNSLSITELSDLKKAGWTTSITPFEVGARGQVTKKNTETIQKMRKIVNIKNQHRKLITDLSRISLLASFAIFQAGSQPTWESPPFLYP